MIAYTMTNIRDFIKSLKELFVEEGLLDSKNEVETNGLISHLGSTGFSVKKSNDKLIFRVAVSGVKAGINYEQVTINQQTFYEPTNYNIVYPKLKDIFKKLGFEVYRVELASYQTQWSDEIGYYVETNWAYYLIP